MNERLSRSGWLAACAGMFLCYFIAADLGMRLADPATQVSPLWPAAGVSMAALLCFGPRKMWLPLAACVCLEAVVQCLRTGSTIDYGALAGNVCGPLIGAFLLERFADGRRFLEHPGNIVRFMLLGASCSGLVSAAMGTMSLCLQGRVAWFSFSDVALSWCVSDLIGTLLVVPVMLTWTTRPAAAPGWPPPAARLWEMAVLFATTVLLTQIAFSGWPMRFHRHSLEYLCIPVLLWTAFRFPRRGVTTVVAVVAGLAVADTLAGRGPFAEHSYSLTLLQMYLGCISLLALATAAVVTEREAQERALHAQGEALRLVAAEAERANHSKSEFLSRMSHELRTPLNAILGFAQLLEIEDPNPIQSESIQHILKGGRHLLSLINEVLDLARVEAGRLHVFSEPLDAGEIFHESIEMVTPLIWQSGLSLETHFCPDDTHRVLADPQRLKQILVNLLSNAVKFNRERGVITASCCSYPAAGKEGGHVMRLSVRDTGPGIAAEDRTRIFTAFDRGSADQNRVEGTGLGLALAKNLAELMGGTLTLESIVSEGSLFILELPCAESAHPAFESPAGEPRAGKTDIPRRRVLYIEDDPASLALMKHLLAGRTDIEFLSSVRGDDGLALALESAPDLVLLDLDLPGLHGREVLAALRADERTQCVPVLMVSANTLPQTIDEILAAGATMYLTKPINTRELLRAVDLHLHAAAPQLAVSSSYDPFRNDGA